MNLEEMRNQFAILKEQLAKQEIVNDHLIRETMKVKIRDISNTKKIAFVGAALGLLAYPLIYSSHLFSLAFTIVTCLLLIGSTTATYFMHKPVEKLNLMQDDFATVAHVMAKFKKQYNNWHKYVSPMVLIPWIIWACYDFGWKNNPDGINPWLLTFSGIIGAIIGWIICNKYDHKAMNAAQEIIDEIEKN